MDKLKKTLSGEDEEETGIVTQISDASTLSWETRIKGFIICFVLGVTLSILGSCLIWLKNGLILFGVLYTFGNILSLASQNLSGMDAVFGQVSPKWDPPVTNFFFRCAAQKEKLSCSVTCFLMGPMSQLKKMFAKTRIIATILVIVMFVLTLVCAFALKSVPLTIICCVLQFLALTWYSLSYIPYARNAVKNCFGSCLE